jgi:hypothetical protein
MIGLPAPSVVTGETLAHYACKEVAVADFDLCLRPLWVKSRHGRPQILTASGLEAQQRYRALNDAARPVAKC